MLLTPTPYKRGDRLETFGGALVGAIGAFGEACVGGTRRQEPLEVLLVQGNQESGFKALLGDSQHHVYEGPLTEATVSFTLEAFRLSKAGEPLAVLQKDSACVLSSVHGDLRVHTMDVASKEGFSGGLLHVKGVAKDLHTYSVNNSRFLNKDTKTFEHSKNPVAIEGWGNYSLVDGLKPFVHIHGTYLTPNGVRHGGHFIMDENTALPIEKATLTFYPVPELIRSVQGEDFPTWKVHL